MTERWPTIAFPCRLFVPLKGWLAVTTVSVGMLSADDPERLELSAPLTHSDWMLPPGVEGGAAGVHHMLDACKASGWKHVRAGSANCAGPCGSAG